jgi:cation:H+ antiporter
MKEQALAAITGNGPLLPFAAFLLLGAVIFVVASRLARAADAIADTTGLGRAWIGVILLGASTSLPEITTDVNAALFDVPDIGVGDLMGSTLANMLILALLDLVYAKESILHKVAVNHAVVGLLAIALTMIAGIAIATGGFGRIGHVGIESLLIVGVYLLGMRVFYQLTQTASEGLIPDAPHPGAGPDPAVSRRQRLRAAVWTFALAALALVVVTPLLVLAAEAISIESGLSETFIGTLLVGTTTSFPEMAATVAAVRLGAIDLAVGNIFGSNAFNMCVILVMDLAYLEGPVLASISQAHVLTAQLAALTLSFGVMGLMSRLEHRSAVTRFGSVLVVGCYAAGIWLLSRG